ncbi:DUF354 domain-containing protein [Natronolimnohabitans innermongolicus]|uniref:DUF354 domain-containing protein n=1 Tax=Natronolimnohabitans innermongolicus JCM 12255 TaxID=1227499 RepID=L9XFY4_9EURY|nr:DUF354 domain-containing protein [Natronolimnohabitans innermongolicus]ELY60625.1 hypothetical protein C493_04091 [Natronolimnohabitans innermongolicus JCM 12255]
MTAHSQPLAEEPARVIVTIQHPGHVHFFREPIETLRTRGHEVFVFARENDVAIDLLEAYDIEHEVLAGASDSLLSLAAVQATYEAKLLRRARRIDPDVITAIGGVAAAHVASMLRTTSLVFYDTEHATLVTKLAYPFADVICTPSCYRGEIGSKQETYPGYHELAYLHPDRFTPDPAVLEPLDLAPDDRFAVVRLGSWEASHDVGHAGFDDPREIADRFEDAGVEVLLSAEGEPPADLEDYQFETAPEHLHDLLAYADVVLSEGATTAAEAAVLGTPAVYVNPLSLGYTSELEETYGLCFEYTGEMRHVRGLERAVSILEEPPETWPRRRQKLLADRIDVSEFVVEKIETLARTSASNRSNSTPTTDPSQV